MFSDMKIKGSISVVVDAIDIEQIEIDSPHILRESPSVKAMLAARKKPSFEAINRVCTRAGHALQYDNWEKISLGRVEVTFTVRPQTREERDEQCPL